MCAVPPILLAVGLWTAATGAGNAANFGAIASSPSNGAWGVSYNAATPAGANEVALNYCSGFAGSSSRGLKPNRLNAINRRCWGVAFSALLRKGSGQSCHSSSNTD